MNDRKNAGMQNGDLFPELVTGQQRRKERHATAEMGAPAPEATSLGPVNTFSVHLRQARS